MRSILYDYRWKEKQEGDEITWKYTFIHVYKLSIWLENYIILNCIAAGKLIEKVSSYFNEDQIEQIKQIYYSMSFPQVAYKEENMRAEIIKYYAKRFMDGDLYCAKKELDLCIHYKSSFINTKSDSVILFVYLSIILVLLIIFLVVTYLPIGISEVMINEIHVFFPAFSFSIIILFFTACLPITIFIFQKYKINYIFLLELEPQLKYNPYYMIKVKYSNL
jgi:hypothetical protein